MPNNKPHRKAKSYKADGTPKRRWTAAERAARGHKPRNRGGAARHGTHHNSGRAAHTDPKGRSFQAWDPAAEVDGGRRHDDQRQGKQYRDDWHRDERSRGGRSRGDNRHGGSRGGYGHGSGGYRGNTRHTYRREDRRDRTDRRDWNDQYDARDRASHGFEAERRDRDARGRDRYGKDWRRGDRRGSSRRDDWRDDHRAGHGNERSNARHDWDERGDWHQDDAEPRNERRGHERREHDRNRDRWDRHNGGGRGSHDSRSGRRDRDDWHADGSDADTMEWKATDLGELDTSTVNHEGGFSTLGVPDPIVAALAATGIDEPFRIQIAAIPDAISGKDVLGRASTGSGKTLAFSVPVLTRLSAEQRADRRPRALVLSPTRELAMQIADVISPLASAMHLSTILVAGGMGYGPQTKAFKKGVDIVVATPGRLVDLLETGDADLSGVQMTVLDEADHMADLGFMQAVGAILDAVGQGQKLLFSATLDGAVNKLVRTYMNDPVTHEIDPERGSVATMTHHAFQVKPHEKVSLMAEISHRAGHTIVFARTQRGASRMAEQLREAGVMAGALHGGLTQGARARVLAAFKEGSLPVLVATDVAARGIDVDDVTLVLQVDPPMNSKDYLHRAGRTARAGQDGAVISLILPHQRRTMARIYRSAGVHPEEAQVRLGDEHVAQVAHCTPALDAPIAQEEYDAIVAPKPQRRKGRGGGRRNGHGRHHHNDRRGGDRHHSDWHGSDRRGGRDDSHVQRRPRKDREQARRDHEARYGRAGNDTW